MAKQLVPKSSNVTEATIRKHIRAISGYKIALESAQGEYRSALKSAKADGINTKEFIAAMAAKKREAEDVHGDLRAYLRYLSLFDMPVTQGELFGTEAAAAPDEAEEEPADEHGRWEAEQAGRQAGQNGELRESNPHCAGTCLAGAWHGGWLRGQEDNARSPEGVKKASARRQRARVTRLHS